MFKNEVEPRAAGEWFDCQLFMVCKSIDHRNLMSICFLFFLGSFHVTSDVIFIDNSYEPVSGGNIHSYCKNPITIQ